VGYKSQMIFLDGSRSTNAVVWPDEESARLAGLDLLSRWFVPVDSAVIEVDEEPNRPTWDEWVNENGLPPQSVSL